MKRREFITLLGGAAVWPLAARAQPREQVRKIGVLMSTTADDTERQARIVAFLQGLQQSGWAVSRNVSSITASQILSAILGRRRITSP